MIQWIRENTGLFSLAASLVLVIASGAVAYHQLSGLIAAQSATEQHIHDSTRHIDPMRDGMSQKHLADRLERLEGRVIRLEAQRRERWRERGRNDEK